MGLRLGDFAVNYGFVVASVRYVAPWAMWQEIIGGQV
jgi:hypothetical protein